MRRPAKKLNQRSPRMADHDALIRHGADLHEARRYAAALPWFERALHIAPQCPVAIYNRANTLHMLDRDQEAEPLLRGLIRATPEELRAGCAASGGEACSLTPTTCCSLSCWKFAGSVQRRSHWLRNTCACGGAGCTPSGPRGRSRKRSRRKDANGKITSRIKVESGWNSAASPRG